MAALEEQLRTLRDQQECDRKANEKKAEELARARAIEAGKYQKAKAKLEEEVQQSRGRGARSKDSKLRKAITGNLLMFGFTAVFR